MDEKWLVISDTHFDEHKSLGPIMDDAIKRGVTQVIHCGDIDHQHWNPASFRNLPMAVALVEHQVDDGRYSPDPEGWRVTRPGQRIIEVNGHKVYLGHKHGWDCLMESQEAVQRMIDEIRKDNDGVRRVFCGHSHRAYFWRDPLVAIVNPGYAEGNYEYALLDPQSGEITFTHLPFEPIKQQDIHRIAVIADSEDITAKDSTFWEKFATELRQRKIETIIHCGGITKSDIGREELSDFQVWCNQPIDAFVQEKDLPDNWQLIDRTKRTICVGGCQFYIKHRLGREFMGQSEFDLHTFSMELREDHPDVQFVLCGGTHYAFAESGEIMHFLDPGDIVNSRSFVTIELPRKEITFARVPQPKPSIPYA